MLEVAVCPSAGSVSVTNSSEHSLHLLRVYPSLSQVGGITVDVTSECAQGDEHENAEETTHISNNIIMKLLALKALISALLSSLFV